MRSISRRICLIVVALGLVLGGVAPAQENVFKRALVADVKGFDPCNAADVYCCDVVANVFETLVQYSYLDRPCKVIPCLAEAMPQVSADLLTYTFKLRKGVKFTDDACFTATAGKGRELNATDVIYSFKRICDSRNHSYGWPSFDKKVLGINAWHAASADAKDNTIYDKPVEGFQAPDPYTVVIKLTEPYPQLLYNLCSPTLSVVPREAVETYGQEFLN
ncbi:MAG: heme-binding protein, partial [Candidatus Riflebacteria bacterium]|nr:heme-binding protein [Candidatus Riflebacteria bacterium]